MTYLLWWPWDQPCLPKNVEKIRGADGERDEPRETSMIEARQGKVSLKWSDRPVP